ncbi:CPBP family intramembrane glutamic endopeptidase [Streptomyces sp. st140]|uniref:CPBP family intramembrane glutamic endopeptidase n=1 Tax=Streptomyces sp. st140 TaxID=1828052 RepID=UPI000BF24845|nr:CPBP family intramembrane glutamic endopeptidase [Streptomyces sp. st140]
MADAIPAHDASRPDTAPPARPVKVWLFLVLVAVYLVIVQGMSAVLSAGQGFEHGKLTTDAYVIRTIVIPVGLGVALLVAVVGHLRAWDEIFRDRRPVQRWLIALPLVLFATVAAITNYPGLADRGLAFALLLLVATLMVGFGEELLFRGIGVTAFRQAGHSEFRVGLWTTLLFGAAHGTNIFSAGPQALVQVVATSCTGLVFYLILRRTGALVVSMAAHGLWDFAVLSSQIDPEESWPLVNVSAVVLVLLLLLVLILRRRITPGAPTAR